MSMLNDSDLAAINDLLKQDFSGWFKSNDGGPYLREFEKRFGAFVGAKHGVAVS